MGKITEALGLTPKAPKLNLPDPVIPAPPAPSAVLQSGAEVALGSNDANQRVSGRAVKRTVGRKTGAGISGLGKSGLSV